MVVRRSWVLIALSLVAVALVAIGYWFWRPVPLVSSYIPTNNHLIIGFGSDYLHNDLADIGQIPLGSWRQQLLDYLQSQAPVAIDQIEQVAWSTDATATQQTMIVQLKHTVSKQQQEQIRSQLIGKPSPLVELSWQEVVFVGPLVIITTEASYQPPTQPNSLLTSSQVAAVYILWDQPWPKSLHDRARSAGFGFITEQSAGTMLFDSRDSLRRLIVRLPQAENISQTEISLPPTDSFEVYVAGQTESLVTLKDFSLLQPWYQSFEHALGQNYGLSLTTALKSFGSNFVFLLNQNQWLTQSSTSSLQQVASLMSGYLQPAIKRGTLPDGSRYQELVRSEGQSSTTTVAGQAVRVWNTSPGQAVYQFDQSGRSTLSNNLDLVSSVIAPQAAKGSWQACLPLEKLTWTNILWLQSSSESKQEALLQLPEPWKAAGVLSGYAEGVQEYIFCIL